MPKLDDPIHLDMHRASPRTSALGRVATRLRRLFTGQVRARDLYGFEWGDPDGCPPLAHVRDHFVKARVRPDQAALEIGPGGGRWTRYLLGFRELYVVDYHAPLLDELRRNFRQPHLRYIHNTGTDFPGVPDGSIDFLFSFGVFVHLDRDLIQAYLRHMRRVLKPGALAVLQYADQTKLLARQNPGFSDNDPARMRALVLGEGYRIVEEDLTTLWHSSVVCFTPDP